MGSEVILIAKYLWWGLSVLLCIPVALVSVTLTYMLIIAITGVWHK